MRAGRAGTAVAAVVLAGAAGACGGGPDDGLVVSGHAPAAPYRGPLHVPYRDTDGRTDPASLAAAAGAAGLALECDGTLYAGGGSDPWSRGDGGKTPEEGLRAYFAIEQPDVPRHGYRLERRDGDRALFSFDVDGRTKVAVVVAEDQPGRPGWGPETSASCDPAELPASFTDRGPYEIWTDRSGHRVPVTTLSSATGSAACGWQSARFLDLGAASGGGRSYARDPGGVLPPGMLTSPYDAHAVLPAGARDTGYRLHGRQLWTTPDTSAVYVRTARTTEAWPAVAPGHACQ